MDATTGVGGQGSGVRRVALAAVPVQPIISPTDPHAYTPAHVCPPTFFAVHDGDAVAIAPYEVEVFADLVCEQPAEAAAMLRALSASACTRQALAHLAWLHECGIPITLDAILDEWSALLTHHAQR